MIAMLIFAVFVALMLLGVPIGVALMLGGAVGIGLGELGWLAIPNNFYAGIAKYPLLALPMFVLVGSIFDRSGVAQRLVDLAIALVGRGSGHAAAGRDRGGDVPRRHLGLGSGQRRSGRRRDAGGDVARRLPARVLGQRDRRGRRHRHPDPAVDRVHRLLGDGAGRVGAGAVRRRHDPGRAGRAGADRAGRVAGAQARLRRRRSPRAAAAAAAGAARGRLGPVRAGADPGRHARGLVHADRGRGGRGGLRAVRRRRRLPHDPAARPRRHLRRGGRAVGRDHDHHRAREHLRLRGQHAGHRRPARERGHVERPGVPRRADGDRRACCWRSAWCSTACRSS